MLNPSWCLEVKMMYFIPASFAVLTQLSASNNTGLNSVYKLSYSAMGTSRPLDQPISVPLRDTGPQWINIPNLSSENNSRLSQLVDKSGYASPPPFCEYALMCTADHINIIRMRILCVLKILIVFFIFPVFD